MKYSVFELDIMRSCLETLREIRLFEDRHPEPDRSEQKLRTLMMNETTVDELMAHVIEERDKAGILNENLEYMGAPWKDAQASYEILKAKRKLEREVTQEDIRKMTDTVKMP